MSVVVTVAATADDVRLLAEAATEVQGSEVSAAGPLDTAGDGLAFPVDPETAVEMLQVVAAVGNSVRVLQALLSTWMDRRRKATTTESGDQPPRFVISDLQSGKTLYVGSELRPEELERLLRQFDDESPK